MTMKSTTGAAQTRHPLLLPTPCVRSPVWRLPRASPLTAMPRTARLSRARRPWLRGRAMQRRTMAMRRHCITMLTTPRGSRVRVQRRLLLSRMRCVTICRRISKTMRALEGTGADCEEGDPHDHDVVDGGEDEEEEENEAEEGIADPKVAGDVVDSDSDNEDDLPYQELPAFAGFVSQEALRVLTHHTQNTSRLSEIAELAAAVADSPCPASDAIVHRGNPTPFQHTHSTEVPSSTSGNSEDTPSSTSTRSEREQA
mmetsp:Transcript_21541/g.52765  ORF Transcript_21541/g.52765 Transcript_21541/m.52765 type:complete len:256 (+) Transcript_21541:162-929(+)